MCDPDKLSHHLTRTGAISSPTCLEQFVGDTCVLSTWPQHKVFHLLYQYQNFYEDEDASTPVCTESFTRLPVHKLCTLCNVYLHGEACGWVWRCCAPKANLLLMFFIFMKDSTWIPMYHSPWIPLNLPIAFKIREIFTFTNYKLLLVRGLLVGNWSQPMSYPEPSSFLLRMLNENERLWKGPILRRSWLVLWNVIQYNKSAICRLLEPVLSRALCFCRACTVRS